jgi:hypothetical protein
MKKTIALVSALLLFAGAAAACGDDDSGGGSGSARAEIADALLAEADGEVDRAQAECFADGMIDLFGESEARAFAQDPDNWEPDIDETDMEAAMELMMGMFELIESCDIPLDADF